MKLSNEDIARVKGLCCLRDKTTEDSFNVRVITRNGKITADESHAIADAATKFGSGEIAMTSRQTVEIQKVPYDKIDGLIAFLNSHGLETGGTGPKVRPVVSCKGTTCVFGLIDTFALSEAIHHRFYKGYRGFVLPHKFKIAVGGCPNNCVKPDLNDIGIIGQRVPLYARDKCRGCKKCLVSEACPAKAVSVVDGVAVIDAQKCTKCGVCVGKCPFGAVPAQAKAACRVFVGGTWGKTQRMGTRLNALYAQDDIADVIEKVMLWYKENGYVKERLGATVDRLGVEALEAAIATDDLLNRKDEIIAKDLLER